MLTAAFQEEIKKEDPPKGGETGATRTKITVGGEQGIGPKGGKKSVDNKVTKKAIEGGDKKRDTHPREVIPEHPDPGPMIDPGLAKRVRDLGTKLETMHSDCQKQTEQIEKLKQDKVNGSVIFLAASFTVLACALVSWIISRWVGKTSAVKALQDRGIY